MKYTTPILDLYRFDFEPIKKMSKNNHSLSLKFILIISICFFLAIQLMAQEETISDQEPAASTEEAGQEEQATSDDGIPTDPEIISQGESLFKGNCTTCHAIHEKVIGPALKNVHQRRPTEWLYAFIKNSQKVIQSGDEYAVNLYNEYNQVQMTSFNFKNEEILSILAYIKSESAKTPQAEVASTEGTADATEASGSSVPTGYLTAILIGLVVVLVLILIVLYLIVSVLTKYLKDKKEGIDEADKELVTQKFSIGKLVTSNGFIGIVVFAFTAIVLKTLIDGAFTIGVQQGYQPTQPIAFSHKIHAGQYEIECQYCHTGVMESKSANIPSANICMNCHTAIKTESKEIQKIYAAIDYDPETGQYGDDTQPIEWIRVHNLPDLAYFNHAQHYNVGGVECQTCHGPIEEMEVVYQHSTLTMGWCINCHRETNVNTKDNDYYTNLVKLHEKNGKEPMKVEDIGGLECSKCHY
ncbi:MAG TPA: c-type cytochrome [Cyclobacteriaceae bacterium]